MKDNSDPNYVGFAYFANRKAGLAPGAAAERAVAVAPERPAAGHRSPQVATGDAGKVETWPSR